MTARTTSKGPVNYGALSWRISAALVKTDPPTPPESIPLSRWTPGQYLRQLGVGGWVEDGHARGKATTRWEGTPLHRVALDLHFDGIRNPTAPGATPDDVEALCARLHRWGLPVDPNDPTSEPPKLQIRWSIGQQLRWVIQDLRWQNFELDPVSGRRLQADVTVDLLEHRAPRLTLGPVEQVQAWGADVGRPADSDPAATTPPETTLLYVVRAGDTLTGIAAQFLNGNPVVRAQDIYRLNSPPLVSPDLIYPGMTLQLPAS